ncbi:Rho GTPase-activating protein [Acrasis kona]|uniref:Rho GTPase-activating protein n=1 Tax=Acrasis kona TaxID=1008807 RepID=A0AAW2ZCD8_9EUKA
MNRSRSQSKGGLNMIFSRKKQFAIEEKRRSSSFKLPLDERLKQCRATEVTYDMQCSILEKLCSQFADLHRQQMKLSESFKGYVEDFVPALYRSKQTEDMANMVTLMGCAMEQLSSISSTFSEGCKKFVFNPLKDLHTQTSSFEELNNNQKDKESQYLLRLRDSTYTKELTTYFEHGLQTLNNMNNAVKQIETRLAEPPKRDTATNIFGIPLVDVLGRYTEPGPIPLQIEHCLQFLEANLKEPGIFRIPGHALEVERIKSLLEDGESPDFASMEITNKIHSVCGVVKQYIRDLPEPLLTFERFDSFIMASRMTDPDEQFVYLKKLVDDLPPNNKHLLSRITHTLELVESHQDENKMNAHSIAISFGMNLMRPLDSSDKLKLVQLTSAINNVCELIINNSKDLFESEEVPPRDSLLTPDGFMRNDSTNLSISNLVPKEITMDMKGNYTDSAGMPTRLMNHRPSFTEEHLDSKIDENMLTKWDKMKVGRKSRRQFFVSEQQVNIFSFIFLTPNRRDSLGSWKEIFHSETNTKYYVNTENGERSETHPLTETDDAADDTESDERTHELLPAEEDEIIMSPMSLRKTNFKSFVPKSNSRNIFDE